VEDGSFGTYLPGKPNEEGSMHILPVEDDRKLTGHPEKALSLEGYSVNIAYRRYQAEEKACVTDNGLFILDIMLPGQNRVQVLLGIRYEQFTTPVLRLTGYSGLNNKNYRPARRFVHLLMKGKFSLQRFQQVHGLKSSFRYFEAKFEQA